ncbi:hypothetical protein AB0B25_00830 [Nocardia sp. NPDC049190]|uniref:hypothetical protein n=1 Tax=Nocardia sp. NPDC049190 TaxID=3155650 RepID=UPI0033CC3538
MIRNLMTVAALSAALLSGQTLATTPVAQAGPSTSGKACGFEFNEKPYLLHKAVVVGGTVTCTSAPLQFRIELQLWHRSGTSNPRPKGEPAIDTQIPKPSVHIAAMALDCVPGVWQGKIIMQATWDTGTNEVRKETLATFIPC